MQIITRRQVQEMKKMNEQKKTLNWRLKELPNADNVAALVDSEVITKEEARELLFTEPSSSDEKVKALEEQVEFLKELVKELARKNNGATIYPISRTITTPAVYWGTTSKFLNDSGLNTTLTNSSGSGTYTMRVSSINQE